MIPCRTSCCRRRSYYHYVGLQRALSRGSRTIHHSHHPPPSSSSSLVGCRHPRRSRSRGGVGGVGVCFLRNNGRLLQYHPATATTAAAAAAASARNTTTVFTDPTTTTTTTTTRTTAQLLLLPLQPRSFSQSAAPVAVSSSDDSSSVHPSSMSSSSSSSSPSSRHVFEENNNKALDDESFVKDLHTAAAWNHGQPGKPHDKSLWNYEMCRRVADRYDGFLRDCASAAAAAASPSEAAAVSAEEERRKQQQRQLLLSAETVTAAFKVLLKCHRTPDELSVRVREWERCLGVLRQTPVTDHLSLRLVTANGKAGNVGRALSLLQYRLERGYAPRKREFLAAVCSLKAAAWSLRSPDRQRCLFLSDDQQPATDNPTRWLDAILLNMRRRDFPVTVDIANSMLDCYSQAGWTGRAVHHFYRVVRQPVADLPAEERPERTDLMPKDWFPVTTCDDDDDDDNDNDNEEGKKGYSLQPVKVRLRYNKSSPPFFKVPSQVRDKVLSPKENNNGRSSRNHRSSSSSSRGGSPSAFQKDESRRQQPKQQKENNNEGGTTTTTTTKKKKMVFKLDQETDPQYSATLAAAFAFAESLRHGACGHDPVELNTASYNALVRACVRRGALHRAMHLVDRVMPERGCRPNGATYNALLDGFSRVGDVAAAQEYYVKMINQDGITPDAYTVRAIANGLLNLGDAAAAVTVVQDFFNQHSALPPYTTHLKIIEFCLARDLVHEAKRHVYFLQQLWHWRPVPEYHGAEFVKRMKAVQQNTQLQRPALERLFGYFGETLDDSDFL